MTQKYSLNITEKQLERANCVARQRVKPWSQIPRGLCHRIRGQAWGSNSYKVQQLQAERTNVSSVNNDLSIDHVQKIKWLD